MAVQSQNPEDVPFDDPTWPRYYLMPGKSASEQLSPAAHYASIKQLFLAAAVISKKKTHAPRGAGSRHAQDAGADIASIENHGGWGEVDCQPIICPGSLTMFLPRWLVAHSQENDFGLPGTPFYRLLSFSGCSFHVSRNLLEE
ncbi:hypothetical protein BGZ68_003992, partial [Mortierella alpina]